ncbi:MAG: HEAT repeat domain-containing protein [Deltaproteobacteria bacterium]
MRKGHRLALIVLLLAGCGPRIPDDFTVSGQTLDDWLEALSDSQPETRARAVRALSNVGPDVPEVVPALIEALSDPEPDVRRQAVLALLKFGPGARAAIPALTAAQSDADETVRDLAGKALQKIEGG